MVNLTVRHNSMSFVCRLQRLSRCFSRKVMENIRARECLLQSVGGQFRDVKLSEETSYIGRSPDTEIQDEFCSRKQVMVKADFSSRSIEIVTQGINPSALNGQIMEKKKSYRANHGDVLEIVAGKFPYKILFSPELSAAVKRKIDESPEESVAKVPKNESWTALDGNQLYIWTASGVTSSSKIASYDIDGTIIKTKSGNVFPKNIDDWMLAYPEVPGKLKKCHGEGFKVVFFTNQAAISKKKLKIEDFVKKVKSVVGKINIPIQVFISTGKGIYRKPMVGMWKKLEEQFNDGVKIDMKESFFVGDAAGRSESKGRKKDHSSSDRFMALNLALTFLTPEEHFQGARALPWTRPEFDPKNIISPKSLLEPAGANLMKDHKEIIVMVGSPGSGKSSFVQRNFQGTKYDLVNRDKLGTWQKCVAAAQSALEKGRSVVVDNTNPDIESRKRYTDLAKKIKCRCRCFVMSTTLAQSRHNIAFRELTDPAHVKINDIILNSYKSKFREPQTSEGFEEIVRVNFIPSFQNSDHEELYRMYLLEK